MNYLNDLDEEVVKPKPVCTIKLQNITAEAGSRIGAHLLDGLFGLIVAIPVIIWVLSTANDAFKAQDVAALSNLQRATIPALIYSTVASFILYFIIPVLTKGKTLGKACVGLRIISDTGDYASTGQLFVRSLFYTVIPLFQQIPILGGFIGFGMMIVWIVSLVFLFNDTYRQAIHDKIGNCLVVYDDRFQVYRRALKQAHEANQQKQNSYPSSY